MKKLFLLVSLFSMSFNLEGMRKSTRQKETETQLKLIIANLDMIHLVCYSETFQSPHDFLFKLPFRTSFQIATNYLINSSIDWVHYEREVNLIEKNFEQLCDMIDNHDNKVPFRESALYKFLDEEFPSSYGPIILKAFLNTLLATIFTRIIVALSLDENFAPCFNYKTFSSLYSVYDEADKECKNPHISPLKRAPFVITGTLFTILRQITSEILLSTVLRNEFWRKVFLGKFDELKNDIKDNLTWPHRKIQNTDTMQMLLNNKKHFKNIMQEYETSSPAKRAKIKKKLKQFIAQFHSSKRFLPSIKDSLKMPFKTSGYQNYLYLILYGLKAYFENELAQNRRLS